VSGCNSAKNREAANAVQNYCSILQMTYDRADLNILAQVTTDKEIKKVFPVIQALNATGNSMKTEIVEFKIQKAKVATDKATVQTAEKWRYWWEDRKTGTITKPKSEESYRLEYNLVKNNGQWKVDCIRNMND